MKHASPTALESLGTVLARLRAVPGLVERTPGTFYFRSAAFLHFHEDPAGLFADAKLDFLVFERLPVNSPEDQARLLDAVMKAVAEAGVRRLN